LNEPKVGPEEDAEESERQGVELASTFINFDDRVWGQNGDTMWEQGRRKKVEGERARTRNNDEEYIEFFAHTVQTLCIHTVHKA
jgi:hypothetical protein